MAPALEVEHLTIRFGDVEVVRDLGFTVERGSMVAVVGPNGAGKTALFRALVGAIPHEGTIRWAPRVRLGYVPQKLDLERDVPLTGLDFLRAGAHVARLAPSMLQALLVRVGLTAATLGRPIGTLSGGQFQRLLVAFALVCQPDVLLLDEPTAGVDEPGQQHLHELIDELQRERSLTVLEISHDLALVQQRAALVLCLGAGVACFGPPHTVLTPERLRDLYGAPPAPRPDAR